MMKFYKLNLPDFWASTLVNGDYSGLEEEDIKALNDLVDYWSNDLDFNCVNIPSDENAVIESHFMTFHDARNFGVLACDCCEYQILIKPQSSLND